MQGLEPEPDELRRKLLAEAPSECKVKAMFPLAGRTSAAGAINPALQQVDFYIRSPDTNDANHPSREVFDYFFAMETTWR